MNGDGGDTFEAAFAELMLAAFRVAVRILGNVAEAEDVAAEALARALRSWDRVGALPYRKAWVVRVASNLAIDRIRRRRPALAEAEDPARRPRRRRRRRLVAGCRLGLENGRRSRSPRPWPWSRGATPSCVDAEGVVHDGVRVDEGHLLAVDREGDVPSGRSQLVKVGEVQESPTSRHHRGVVTVA